MMTLDMDYIYLIGGFIIMGLIAYWIYNSMPE